MFGTRDEVYAALMEIEPMTNVTEFPGNPAAAEFRKRDDHGREMFFYCATYAYQGGDWSIEFWAYSMPDALDRIAAMRESVGTTGCFQILERIDG